MDFDKNKDNMARLMSACSRRVGVLIVFPCLLGVLVWLGVVVATAEEAGALRRGGYAVIAEETDILGMDGSVVRKSLAGEVIRIRRVEADKAEFTSARPDLPGGSVPLTALTPASAEAYTAWVEMAEREAELARQQLAPLQPDPSPEDEAALETAEASLPAPPAPPAATPAELTLREPVLGWFAPGADTRVTHLAQSPDGSIFLAGSARPPFTMPGVRAWSGALPTADTTDSPPHVFLARLAPDLKSFSAFVVFPPEDLGAVDDLEAVPDGSLWVAARRASEALAGPDATKAQTFLLHFDPALSSVVRSMALLADVHNVRIDAQGRPIVLTSSPKRSGGGFLTRYFSQGRYERVWPEAPDGATRRLKLDFSSPALADGPFALWAKKSEVYPDMPTPIAPWGSPSNAGEPMVWTNVSSGKNPIRGADLKPEALCLDKEGHIIVAGTIPFHMGNPDFDPFLMRFTPEGKLLWTNCFLDGLLSEPDQKTQALAVDPSNGDILVAYWQHGNNRQTLLLDPNGWLNKFTGTNGNIKITWIGRVDATTGILKNSTYFYAQMPDSKNPRWPDLNSVGVNAMQVADNGRVYTAGATTISMPTTTNAFLPYVNEYGGHPMFAVLRPDLSAPHYSTYLSAGKGDVQHLAILPGGAALCIGRHETQGAALPVANVSDFPYLADSHPSAAEEAVFFAIMPVPEEEAEWSFNN